MQGNSKTVELLGKQVGPVVGSIGDDEFANSVLCEVPCSQFNGFACANENGGLFAQVFEDALSKPDGGKGYGNGAAADRGIGPDFLGCAERVLKELAEGFSEGPGFGCNLIGRFHLAQNLGLAKDHRIQARCDSEHVSNGGAVLVRVEEGLKVFPFQALLPFKPAEEGLGVLCVKAAVEFGSVAGGENGGFFDRRDARKVLQRVNHPLGRKRDAFADRYGGGVVIKTQGDNGHSAHCKMLSEYNSME